MYDTESLLRRINKEGIDSTIEDLKNTNFDKETMEKLESSNIFKNGILNIPFIISLTVM